jgi:hypothetical protein
MEGAYRFRTGAGQVFSAEIARFYLADAAAP